MKISNIIISILRILVAKILRLSFCNNYLMYYLKHPAISTNISIVIHTVYKDIKFGDKEVNKKIFNKPL